MEASVQQTAEIIDLAAYRKSKQSETVSSQAVPMMAPMPFAWVPVWIMVPVPVLATVGTA